MDKRSILKQLEEFVSIQSVSTDPARFSQIQKAVEFLKRKFIDLGFQVKMVKRANYPPLILAIYHLNHDRDQDKKTYRKTIGIYGHYDVQPEDPIEQWENPPFKLIVRNGKLYGRGVADNKGHIIQNLVSINRLIDTEKLKNNLVFILEGEEEIGSVHFEEYVKEAYSDLIGVDVFYLTDVGMANKTTPQIFYGLRGIVYFELVIRVGEHDLHSGVYGNRVINPAQILADLMIKIKPVGSHRIKIPHFYDDCRKIPKEEEDLLKHASRNLKDLVKNAGVYRMVKFDDIHPSLASKIYPSFDINGLSSGYTGCGQKTIIPATAAAKFSFRLVEQQDPDEIEDLVKKFIKQHLPDGVKYELKTFSKAAPFYTDRNNQYVKKTAAILKDVFGNKTLFNRSGGSVPAAEVLQRLFKKPIILTGFTLPDSNIHAPNENFDEELFWRGIEALGRIY